MGNLVFHTLAYMVVACLPFFVVNCATKTPTCNQTPYPELCNSIPLESNDNSPFDIRKSVLGFSFTRARFAHSLIQAMNVSSFNKKEKLAFSDCLELYDDTIFQVNRSLSSNDPISTQTWLSAAMTNHQTCRNGFIDFHLSSHLHLLPSPLGDLSKSLSNSLAINKLYFSSIVSTRVRNRTLISDEFPEWVPKNNRKLLQSPMGAVAVDIVVAKDGSGNYKTISEAVSASVQQRIGTKRFVIHVKAGVYKENVAIDKTMTNLMFIGDGIDKTVVTGNKNVQDGSTTFKSATFAISGSGFIARDMTFENTAGPLKQQAVAFRSSSDLSVFYRCSFKGFQDTLYLYTQRQFYRDCDIYGTVDFVFGNAAAVLQNCNIYVRKPLPKQKTTITAQSRSNPNMNTGFVFHNSVVTAGPDLKPVQNLFENYLGRPWKKYSRVVFMKCVLDRLIRSEGWFPWNGSTLGLNTLYYGEYKNTGVGADTSKRVMWAGHHVIMNDVEAAKFTVGNFLAGSDWIAAAGVPFTSGI